MNRKLSQKIAFWIFRILGWAVVGILLWILGFIVYNGIGVISLEFIFDSPRNGMLEGGIFPAIVGTFCLIIGSMIVAFPLGVMSAIYTNEYVRDGKISRFIRMMTNNLGSIPSIVFGLFGMALFVRAMSWGDSIIAGSFTLGLLVLPLVIRTTEEALRMVPDALRTGSYALGASKLQTIRYVVLPTAFPNIVTGLILSVGRVSGETAPILFTVAAFFLPRLPSSVFDQVMALPYHLYVLSTSGSNLEAQRPMAYGTALVLITLVLIINFTASLIRKYFSKKHGAV
ncbi:MAG: phosphate ABC transporter permease PstA [Fibromonadales bacterium]|nr:phosphate ABC transporter permease PstA [Fibromonadales bacterium]